MISEIVLDSVASYKEQVVVRGLKKVNLFYGLNGTGKSTIASLLRSSYPPTGEFSKCALKFASPTAQSREILVYNQEFVRENFLEAQSQKGVFTLDRVNTKVGAEIKASREVIDRLLNEKLPFEQDLNHLLAEETACTNDFLNLLWVDRTAHDRTELKDLMAGFSSPKQKFADKVCSSSVINPWFVDLEGRLTAITREYEALKESESFVRDELPTLPKLFETSEIDVLLAEVIVGAKDGYLAEVITHLNHEDWLIHGINEYLPKSDKCPFCYQALTSTLKENLLSHVDKIYKNKLETLQFLLNDYNKLFTMIDGVIEKCLTDLSVGKDPTFSVLAQALFTQLTENLRILERKLMEPSVPTQLISLLKPYGELESYIQKENDEIQLLKVKIANKQSSIEELKVQYWNILRTKHDAAIRIYQDRIQTIAAHREAANTAIKRLDDAVAIERTKIEELQKDTKNIDLAIIRMNRRLKSFGLEGFQINKVIPENNEPDLQQYKISRDSAVTQGLLFKTLSEGEKTLITFLYFLENCIGVTEKDKESSADDRIIVIDDPISSLSFNLVFDVAALIKECLIPKSLPFRQVIILTHHLYFLHELFYDTTHQLPEDYTLFRVTKLGKSQVIETKRSEIRNVYDTYWQVIRDARLASNPSASVPNAMRNILEHYFSFIHKQDSLVGALHGLASENSDPMFRSFLRFIDRRSHSDFMNLTDMNEIDVNKFINYFREVFAKTGHEDHYCKMMGLEKPANDISDPPLKILKQTQ